MSHIYIYKCMHSYLNYLIWLKFFMHNENVCKSIIHYLNYLLICIKNAIECKYVFPTTLKNVLMGRLKKNSKYWIPV